MQWDKLRKNAQFRTVYRRGKSLSNDKLVLYVFKNRRNRDEKGNLYNKVGFSISKKVGKSVVRSRVKRLMRESFRLNYEKIEEGYDFVFIARMSINDKSFFEVEKSMMNLFKKAGLIKDENNFN
ncbi:MAG: ribonuclease P protein component [Inconstantimicrobium porci]|uniref:Ribonuclease P protein component n=1 Tax=Inconstantimicrobium porci TaxID=2652291 RepID=A0A7X2MYZ2_9CLOT|nr:ribonuclease P protein component [Inconstantimicrobium porci]MDD6771349.1 ribonuclease P protein component [Inconstantimicrobium porci]MDY5911397.1 ribonuclease P protein component [Inconstantimicrobium porci]MSR91678.1 ribonuclease P protein component [Inconstantimicrobium porci]